MSAARVGEHSDVVWKFVKRSPSLASWSETGVGIRPPNELFAAKPSSSISTRRTLGEPFLGAIAGAHHAAEVEAFFVMVPPKVDSGAGITVLWLTSRVATSDAMSVFTMPFHSPAATANATATPRNTKSATTLRL